MTEVLLVALGAGVGAPVRYLTDRAVQRRNRSRFPLGTLTVNVAACLVLGFVTGLGRSGSVELTALIGAGFCGALSTYSTFAYETVRLVELRARMTAGLYVLVSIAAGMVAIELGRVIART